MLIPDVKILIQFPIHVVAILSEETKPNGTASSPSQAARFSPTVDVAVLHCDSRQE